MFRPLLALPLLVLTVLSTSGLSQTPDAYQQLLSLHEEYLKVRQPSMTDSLPDYRPPAIESQKRSVDGLRKRLDGINPAAWPVPRRVDYLLVRAELDGLDFDHRVVRPWARDPGLYVDAIARLPYT